MSKTLNGTAELNGIPAEVREATEALGSPEVQASALRALSSVLVERMRFARQAGLSFGDCRNMYAVLGYDDVLTTSRIRARYERGGIAGRVVDALPKSTWREGFEVYEDEDPKVSTPFEQAIEDFDDRMSLAAKFQKVDILASLSTFAVLLIGAKDGELSKELPRGNGTPDDIIFLQPYSGGGGLRSMTTRNMTVADDADCLVESYVTDSKDSRFGLPLTYQLRRIYTVEPTMQRQIHWTRILHVAHDVLDDNVYGEPSLARVWNLLDDLDKVTGGGAEAFWLRANQGTVLQIDHDASLGTDSQAALEAKVAEWQNQISRFMVTRKSELKSLGSDVANFSNPADAVLTQIAGAKAIPKRILTGSEMGELASSQDRENWRDQIRGRQIGDAGPYIVKPFIQRLLDFNYLPQPRKKNQWMIDWPQIEAMTEGEKADGALKWSQTKAADGSPVFTVDEIREKWYGMEPMPPAVAAQVAENLKQEGVAADKPLPADLQPPTPADLIKTAEAAEDVELLRVLQSAVDANNTDVIDRILGVSRAAGDNPGHEFHGNQWTDSSLDLPKPDSIDTSEVENNSSYAYFNKQTDKWTRASDAEGRQNAFDLAQRDNPSLGKQLREAYFGAKDEDLPKEVSVYRVGGIRDGVVSFFPRLSSATAYQKRFGLDSIQRVLFNPRDLVPTGAGSGEVFGHSDDVISSARVKLA